MDRNSALEWKSPCQGEIVSDPFPCPPSPAPSFSDWSDWFDWFAGGPLFPAYVYFLGVLTKTTKTTKTTNQPIVCQSHRGTEVVCVGSSNRHVVHTSNGTTAIPTKILYPLVMQYLLSLSLSKHPFLITPHSHSRYRCHVFFSLAMTLGDGYVYGYGFAYERFSSFSQTNFSYVVYLLALAPNPLFSQDGCQDVRRILRVKCVLVENAHTHAKPKEKLKSQKLPFWRVKGEDLVVIQVKASNRDSPWFLNTLLNTQPSSSIEKVSACYVYHA